MKNKYLLCLKLMAFILLLCSIVLSFSSCFFFSRENPYPYKGEYKELYTTAIYSIPNAEGYMHHGEGAYNSDIYIWEQDEYGRTLFAYCEDYGNQIFSLLICQGYDVSSVYFYPEVNYLLTFEDSEYLYESIDVESHLKSKTEDFYSENKVKLKSDNDWGKPIEKSKCVSYEITDHKVLDKKAFEFKSWQCNDVLNEYSKTLNLPNPSEVPHRTNKILQIDTEGRVLHEIHGVHQHYDNPDWSREDEYTYYDIVLWVITDAEGNYNKDTGILVIYSDANGANTDNVYNSVDIAEFKKANGWIYAYCTE